MRAAFKAVQGGKQDAYRKLAKERADFSKTFIESHPSSIVSMVVISELQPALDYFDSYEKLEKSLKATGRKSDQLESFYQLVANMKTAYEQRKEQDRLMAENEKNLAIGVLAPEIKLKDPSGRVISSRDFKGKVLLIDFWASWCPPCRAANPELTELYKKHQGKGFEILGVSLDDKEMAWKQAIAMDKLSWPQVSDLGGWRSSVVPQYNIIQLPSSYLLDRNGKIIAKNLAGDSLELKVKTMLR
jgi:thiol-disulfide isomerase/thioredoxin